MLERPEQEEFFGAGYTVVGISSRRPAQSRRRATSQRCAATGIRLDRAACPAQARVISCGRRFPAGHSVRRIPRGQSRDKSRGYAGRRPGSGVCLGSALLPTVCLALGQDEVSPLEENPVAIEQADVTPELTELCQDQLGAYELGPAGITLPQHCVAADFFEDPIMEADVAPELPDQLPDERLETEEVQGIRFGAGVILPPRAVEHDVCQDWPTSSEPVLLVQQLPDEFPEADVQGGLEGAGVIMSELVVQAGFFEECKVSLKPEVADSLPWEFDQEEDNQQGAGVVMAPLALSAELLQALGVFPRDYPAEEDADDLKGTDFVMPPLAPDVLPVEHLGDKGEVDLQGANVMMPPLEHVRSEQLASEADEDAVSVLSLGGCSCRASYEEEAAVAAEEVACFVVHSPLGGGSLDLFVGDPPLEEQLNSLQQELESVMDDVRCKTRALELPVASQMGPCSRRRFPRQLLPRQRPPAKERLMPGVIPLSKPVATVRAPGNLMQLSDEVESRQSHPCRRPRPHRIMVEELEAPTCASCPATPTRLTGQLSPRQPPSSPRLAPRSTAFLRAQAASALRTGCLSPTSHCSDSGRQSACSVPARPRVSRHRTRLLQAVKQDWMLTPRTGMSVDSTNFIWDDVSTSWGVPSGSRWPQSAAFSAGESTVGLLPALKCKPVKARHEYQHH